MRISPAAFSRGGSRWASSSGGPPHPGHFAALTGFIASPGGTEFVVADPKYGNGLVLDAELRDGRYRGSGSWTDLYRTAGAR